MQIFKASQNETDVAINWLPPCSYSDDFLVRKSENCASFLKKFRLNKKRKKSQFPLAYVLIVSDNAEQFIRLLQVIFLLFF